MQHLKKYKIGLKTLSNCSLSDPFLVLLLHFTLAHYFLQEIKNSIMVQLHEKRHLPSQSEKMFQNSCIFSWKPVTSKVTGEGAVKKTIAFFGYKQQLLSIDMKTKLVQHVKRE